MALHIPGYKITKILGKGGMATVYLAVQEIFEREVALKVMAKGLTEDPSFGQRFMREAQIVSKLAHPNIVTVYDVGVHDGTYYLSMEYISGSDLKHARKELNFLHKIAIVKQIASALDVAGAKGYVHRDIKPENIMVESATRRAVLMDFGIARASEADVSVTQAGTAIGTPHYMSPEQAKGLEVDTRADLYSLGVVLFYIITGYVPFEGDSAVAIGIRHITEAIPELPAHLKDMQWFIDKSMAKSPDQRFQSGAEFIAALDSIDLDYIAKNANRLGNSADAAPLDSPTIISEAPVHRYGDSSRRNEPESFTLSFQINEAAPILNIRWPLYMALSIVTLLAASGVYLVATYEPTPIENAATILANSSAHAALGNLILGKTSPLTPAQEARAERLGAAIEASLKTIHLQTGQYDDVEVTKVVGFYRELLQLTPNNPAVINKLNDLATALTAELDPRFNRGDFKEAQRILASIITLFPKYESPELKRARSQMTQRSKLEDLLAKGQRAWNQEQLVEPMDDNANDYYQAALALAPDLIPAKEGITNIAQYYVAQSQKALRNAEPALARQAIHLALTVLPSYPPALELEGQILSSSTLEEKISALLDQAQRHQKNARYFAPAQQNAFATYTAILALDRHNTEAQIQQESLLAKQHTLLSQVIAAGKIDDAQKIMEELASSQPNLTIIQKLQATIADEITTYQYQHLPRIGTIKASGVGHIDLTQRQPRTIAVSDKIFFKFDYFNLNEGKVLLQAQLIDHSSNKALTSKPIFVNGPQGQSEFVLDLDRSGLKAGRYRLELILSNKTIVEFTFNIG
ncbi:MAG: protein kinase [Marinagarivorans sp.]|nr:protein kinase [Marinagarivorans sp.]